MTQHANAFRAIEASTRRGGRRLRRTALAGALAAAGLLSGQAWAVTDACLASASTVVSVTIPASADTFCLLSTGKSLTINTGITFNGTNSSDQTTVTASGAPAGSIDNFGTINSSHIPIAVTGTLSGGINNRLGAFIDGGEGILVTTGGQLQNGITNLGTIRTLGSDACDAILVNTGGSITGGIFNRGAITRSTSGGCSSLERAIANFGSIDAIDNLQGSSTPLTLRGILPGTYRIIVDSTASFGRLAASSPTGTMAFDISPGSTLAVNTYADVLTGVPSTGVPGAKTGTFGGFNWELRLANEGTGTWDLIVTQAPPPPPSKPEIPVPALPVWGGALLSVLLGALGALRLRRRR